MNAWGLSPGSVPNEALPLCGHGHEVAQLWRTSLGYRARCAQCRAMGEPVAQAELELRGWRIADIEALKDSA
jgi:hypothetical protein